jgi:hypothetical protein
MIKFQAVVLDTLIKDTTCMDDLLNRLFYNEKSGGGRPAFLTLAI